MNPFPDWNPKWILTNVIFSRSEQKRRSLCYNASQSGGREVENKTRISRKETKRSMSGLGIAGGGGGGNFPRAASDLAAMILMALAIVVTAVLPLTVQAQAQDEIEWDCFKGGGGGAENFLLVCDAICEDSEGNYYLPTLPDGSSWGYAWTCPNSDIRAHCNLCDPAVQPTICRALYNSLQSTNPGHPYDPDTCHLIPGYAECEAMVQTTTGASCVPPSSSTNTPPCTPPEVENDAGTLCVCPPDTHNKIGDDCLPHVVCDSPWRPNEAKTACICPPETHRLAGEGDDLECLPIVSCDSPKVPNLLGTECVCPPNMPIDRNSGCEAVDPQVAILQAELDESWAGFQAALYRRALCETGSCICDENVLLALWALRIGEKKDGIRELGGTPDPDPTLDARFPAIPDALPELEVVVPSGTPFEAKPNAGCYVWEWTGACSCLSGDGERGHPDRRGEVRKCNPAGAGRVTVGVVFACD